MIEALTHKGNGLADAANKTRWLMRSTNGSTWVTVGYYTRSEVRQWECARPVQPYGDFGAARAA